MEEVCSLHHFWSGPSTFAFSLLVLSILGFQVDRQLKIVASEHPKTKRPMDPLLSYLTISQVCFAAH